MIDCASCVRFISAIRTRVTISTKEDDPKRSDMGRVVERCEILNQRNEVVLAADHILLVERIQNRG
jgi:monoamine oxidase